MGRDDTISTVGDESCVAGDSLFDLDKLLHGGTFGKLSTLALL